MRYDKEGNPIFKKDQHGCDKYERDRHGNERYPSKGFPFARDSDGNLFYARKVNGDEIYPKRNKMSLTIKETDQTDKPARCVSGKEIYPTDKFGNEYYFIKEGIPYLLKDEEGRNYFARTKDGDVLIPWNWMHEHQNVIQSLYPGLDSIGNVIYSNKRLSPYIINSCPIICYLVFTIPSIFKCSN